MDLHIDPNSRWIGLLVKELDIVREKERAADLNGFRTQLDRYQLPERIRQSAAAINEEIGCRALYLLDFLPPQDSVVRVSIFKNKNKYIMKIVHRASGVYDGPKSSLSQITPDNRVRMGI
jgi:hypothetical protein